jgi:hypothetical protein
MYNAWFAVTEVSNESRDMTERVPAKFPLK